MADGAGGALEELEIDLLLEALLQRFGYDFRAYDRAALRGRLHALMGRQHLHTVSALQDAILHQPTAASELLRALSVQPIPLFDDPELARLLRIVLTCLHASPVPKVWLPDCPGVEAAWSLAILLAEERLHARTEIYATVGNDELLAEVDGASIALDRMEAYQENYLKGGGTGSLARYFDMRGKRATLIEPLRSRITWSQYSLVTDASPNEFQLIVCRRALQDFGPVLRQRVLRLFHDSLCMFGVLGIDRAMEASSPLTPNYQQLFPNQPWYKRTA